MAERQQEIEQRIEQTREEMGDTVDALSHKADVPGRMKGWVGDKKDAVVDKVAGAKDAVTGAAGGAASTVADKTPDGAQLKQGAGRAKSIAESNPIGLAIGGAAVGFIAGLFVPSTRVEDERLGEVSDQVKDSAKETAQEAVEHGKQVAQAAAQSATRDGQGRGPVARAGAHREPAGEDAGRDRIGRGGPGDRLRARRRARVADAAVAAVVRGGGGAPAPPLTPASRRPP